MRRELISALFMAGAIGGAAMAAEVAIEPEARTGLAVTVYSDFAFVREARRAALVAGLNELAFPGVSRLLEPETVQLAAPGARVVERRFEADVLSPERLLAASVGRTVRVVTVNPATGVETVETAEVLAAENGVVLRIGDRIESAPAGRIVFDALPPGVRARPTLAALIEAGQAGPAEIELGYLTSGLAWRADYVASLDAAATRMALSLWATITNESGVDYPGARLALIAGEVARAGMPRPVPMARAAVAMAAEMAPGVVEAPAGDYRRFALVRPVDLRRGAETQVALMEAGEVPVERAYRLDGAPAFMEPGGIAAPQPVEVRLRFANTQAAGLGVPLPAGMLRVYTRGADAAFLGEAALPATPKDERAELALGRAFDVTARRTVTDFRQEGPRNAILETAQRIVLSNARAEAVTVEVAESMPGEFRILEESQAHETPSALRPLWRVAVPAGGSAELTYRVRIERR